MFVQSVWGGVVQNDEWHEVQWVLSGWGGEQTPLCVARLLHDGWVRGIGIDGCTVQNVLVQISVGSGR